MNKYIIGAVAGATSLAVAFPLVAQFASAAETGTTPQGRNANRPAPTQACVQALADRDGTFLSSIDAMIAAQKTAVQAHKDALTAAAAITDDTQRKAAVEAANTAFRTAMKTAMDAQREAHKTEMDAIKTACGNAGYGMGGGFGEPMMEGRGPRGGGMGFHMNKGGHGRGQPIGSNSERQ